MTEILHPEEAVTTLIVIRHGHTAQTESGLIYSDPASSLTDKGIEEVEAMAAWIPRENPEVLISSPSTRAQATAAAIARVTSLRVDVAQTIKEQQVGDWEGKSYLEIKKSDPGIYSQWLQDPIRNAPPGGESLEQLCGRVKGELDRLLNQHAGCRVVLVTHAEVARAILVYALGMPVDNFWRLSVPTGSASRVDFSANFATVRYMGLRP